MSAQGRSAETLTRKASQEFMERLARGLLALANVGDVAIGTTPKDEIYREDKLVLYRYRALAKPGVQRIGTPLLICYALVNRPYMLDLQPDRSLIRGLLERGVDVWLIDWGYPDGADRFLALADYVQRYLPNCVAAIQRAGHRGAVNLLGVCQGGTLGLCYAALSPRDVRNLVTMVTPVDFRTPDNLLTKWTEHLDVDALVSTVGNVPGEMLNAMFLALMPFRLTGQKYVDVLDHIDDPGALENFLRMEKWIFDSPDHPGELFREFTTMLVKQNQLMKGTLAIGGRTVDLRKVTMPVLNIYARQDHLVPPSASKPLAGLVGTRDYETHEFKGGHIGIYVSGSAQREVPERIASWLRARDATRGKRSR
jgi:polyhydroxyalkanoate synthase